MVQLALGWAVFLVWALVTFTVLEHAWPRRPGHPAPRRIAIAACLLAVDAAIARAIVPSSPAAGPIARIVLAWLVTEVLLYWVHRAMHRVPMLWRFHRMHHGGEPLSWVAAWYLHPVDAALLASCAWLGGVVAGAGIAGVTWFVVGRRAWTVLLHANLAWPRTALDEIVATPPFHDRHHCEELAPANFASTLPVLDRLFGSHAVLHDAPQIGSPGRHELEPDRASVTAPGEAACDQAAGAVRQGAPEREDVVAGQKLGHERI
jgi:sterol desaturase/sphingolipid hydroxylase (fatty acid hydroxylase superfamily)